VPVRTPEPVQPATVCALAALSVPLLKPEPLTVQVMLDAGIVFSPERS
jgi:hypothetical protein